MTKSKFNRVMSLVSSVLCSVLELLVSVLLTVSLTPTLLVLWLINGSVRLVISIIFYIKSLNPEHPKYSLISEGSDGIWDFQKPGNSRNIIILYVYNSRMSLDTFQKNYNDKVLHYIDSSTGSKPFQKLTKIFKTKFGYYCWEECKNFNISNHIRTIYDNEEEIVTESQVLKYMSTLITDMDDSQPQWEEILVPRFMYDNNGSTNGIQIPQRSARIYRSHHAFMDGCSNLLMAGTCMGEPNRSFPYVLDPTAPIKTSAWKHLLYKAKCVLFGLTTVVKSLYFASRIKSRFLMKNYSGKQSFTWSPSMDLNMIRSIKDKTRVSVPAILSSAIIGALKKLDEGYPFVEKRSNSSVSSVSMKSISFGLVGAILPYPDIHPRNRFTVVNFTSKVIRNENRITRLATTQKEMRKLVQSPDGLVAYSVFQIFGKLPVFMIQLLMSRARTPVIYSNVPWASEMVKLWDCEVNDVAGWMPLLTAAGLGLLSVTYNNKIRLCVITDEKCLSKVEVKYFIDEVLNEIKLLSQDSLQLITFKEDGIHNL